VPSKAVTLRLTVGGGGLDNPQHYGPERLCRLL